MVRLECALVVVAIWLARVENVRVSYESQRRPRGQVGTSPAPDPTLLTKPQAAR